MGKLDPGIGFMQDPGIGSMPDRWIRHTLFVLDSISMDSAPCYELEVGHVNRRDSYDSDVAFHGIRISGTLDFMKSKLSEAWILSTKNFLSEISEFVPPG